MTKLEDLWDSLLSRHAEEIRSVYSSLSQEEKEAVLLHLKRMTGEPGWQSEQRISASIALKALEETKLDL